MSGKITVQTVKKSVFIIYFKNNKKYILPATWWRIFCRINK